MPARLLTPRALRFLRILVYAIIRYVILPPFRFTITLSAADADAQFFRHTP